MKIYRRTALAVLAALLLAPAGALAATSTEPQNLTLQAAMRPRNSQSTPFTGVLTMRITSDGIINGTYVSNSIRPDPTRGRIVTVTGGLSGTNIHLSFGTGTNLVRVRGTFEHGRIVGTATRGNSIFDFEAQVKQ